MSCDVSHSAELEFVFQHRTCFPDAASQTQSLPFPTVANNRLSGENETASAIAADRTLLTGSRRSGRDLANSQTLLSAARFPIPRKESARTPEPITSSRLELREPSPAAILCDLLTTHDVLGMGATAAGHFRPSGRRQSLRSNRFFPAPRICLVAAW